jgi:Cu+-exporting ATPase
LPSSYIKYDYDNDVSYNGSLAGPSGHIIFMKSNLLQILYALKIGQYSMKKIKQNLSMSFTYIVVTISIAAGLLYGITNPLVLTPALTALGWS